MLGLSVLDICGAHHGLEPFSLLASSALPGARSFAIACELHIYFCHQRMRGFVPNEDTIGLGISASLKHHLEFCTLQLVWTSS